jgi:hypothetical protein
VTAGLAGTDLPDLRIVARSALVLHEDADERRVAALARQFVADAMVKNPPIVAALPGERFVVLDGANRTTALQQLGVPDVVVQVVDYAQVSLSSWNHLIVGVQAAALEDAIRAITGLRVEASTLARARVALVARRSIASFVVPSGTVHDLIGGAALAAQVALLRQVVATYKGRAHIHRVQSDEVAGLRALYSEIGGLIVFPNYRPVDIMAMAEQAAKLPSGITRHVIPRRALRLNLDMDVLWADTNRAEKNRWLGEWLRGKLQAGHVRYYQEPVVIFDE